MNRKGAVLLAILLCATMVFSVSQGAGLWSNMCESCHNGKTAPGAEWMREHFGNTDEFVSAVKKRGSQCMNILKHDETLARKIALELGIKDGRTDHGRSTAGPREPDTGGRER